MLQQTIADGHPSGSLWRSLLNTNTLGREPRMHSDVQSILELVGRRPGIFAAEALWTEAERRLGLSLPSDFKDLVDTFGSGPWAGFLHVFSPSAPDELLLERAAHRALGALHEIRRAEPKAIPFPIFPEALGLFPWGISDNGDTLCWLTEGTHWPSFIFPTRESSWERHNISSSALLLQFLRGTLPSRLLLAPFAGEVPLNEHNWSVHNSSGAA